MNCENFDFIYEELKDKYCLDNGLIKSKEIIMDSTHTCSRANAQVPVNVLQQISIPVSLKERQLYKAIFTRRDAFDVNHRLLHIALKFGYQLNAVHEEFGEEVALLVADEMQLEAVEPSHRALAALGKSVNLDESVIKSAEIIRDTENFSNFVIVNRHSERVCFDCFALSDLQKLSLFS